ncbi:hypothetical protein B0T18DRAFT_433538 [Schizothecium vesticola]|uniref:Uncharacterized protein n=1 Tax=Schizothecium vesticola TaxID=314040 RepID=A0AA40EG72_9PEZI|nr:hypothetical protein B0T18DRAFT_433538 [Schizothecium vesticola]
MNFTIELPVGTTNHGDDRLICTPAKWTDYIIFYATNYFIHAATLPTVPGEIKREVTFAILNALFIPGSGALRAVRRFVFHPALKPRRTPLERALLASALCMVVSDASIDLADSKVNEPDSWTDQTFQRYLKQAICPSSRTVHGVCSLPPTGYNLCVVPPGVDLRALPSSDHGETRDFARFQPSGQYNVVKVLFSLAQAIAGSVTIYKARGDQINQYGFAAFGLTVVPYVFMSVVNIVASLLSPEYPAMYLVRTPDMAAAIKDGGRFEGLVAELVPFGPEDPRRVRPGLAVWPSHANLPRDWAIYAVWIVLMVAPIAIVGGLSGFRHGEVSTGEQRGWLMAWLVLGSLSGFWAASVQQQLRAPAVWGLGYVGIASILIFWVPAIVGMVKVGQQVKEYGICARFDTD